MKIDCIKIYRLYKRYTMILINKKNGCVLIITWFLNFQTLTCIRSSNHVETWNENNNSEEYPFAKKKPGPLSFRIGPIRFRQLVWDRERNKQPIKFKPGPLSFRIGPIRFNQIPQKHLLPGACCFDPTASCYVLANCDDFIWFNFP